MAHYVPRGPQQVKIEYDGPNGRLLTQPLSPHKARAVFKKYLESGKNPTVKKCIL